MSIANLRITLAPVQVANAAVLRLTKEAAWIAEALGALHELRESEDTFIDRSV